MTSTTRTTALTSASISAPLDLTAPALRTPETRLTDGDAYRTASVRKHRAQRTRPWRTTDGQTHPVTISRKFA